MGVSLRHDRAVLLLRALRAASTSVVLWASGLASAQTATTYTLLDTEDGSVLYSNQSVSGLAFTCTTAYRVRFETFFEDHPITGADTLWGRWVRVGSSITGSEAALIGPYWPSVTLSNQSQWAFGIGSVSHVHENLKAYYPILQNSDRHATHQPTPSFPYNGTGVPFDIGAASYPAGTGYFKPPEPNMRVTAFNGPAVTLALKPGVWEANEPDLENPGGWVFRAAVTGLVGPLQQQHSIYSMDLTPDPFKAAGGDTTIDLQPVIDAIDAQSLMQEGYYEDWQVVYDELYEQLTGGASEMDWVARDARRDGYLAEIRDNTTTANDYLLNIWANTALANSHLSNINLGVNSLLQAVTPTQVPPSVPDISGSLDEVEFEIDPGAQLIQPDREELLPDGWDLPDAPPVGESKQWDFVIGISSIPMLGDAMDDLSVSVDLTPYDTWIQLAHLFIIAGFTIASIYGILAELEKA